MICQITTKIQIIAPEWRTPHPGGDCWPRVTAQRKMTSRWGEEGGLTPKAILLVARTASAAREAARWTAAAGDDGMKRRTKTGAAPLADTMAWCGSGLAGRDERERRMVARLGRGWPGARQLEMATTRGAVWRVLFASCVRRGQIRLTRDLDRIMDSWLVVQHSDERGPWINKEDGWPRWFGLYVEKCRLYIGKNIDVGSEP
jgi:hypothetical protein